MELPLKKIPAVLQDPKNLILYGLPKVKFALYNRNIISN